MAVKFDLNTTTSVDGCSSDHGAQGSFVQDNAGAQWPNAWEILGESLHPIQSILQRIDDNVIIIALGVDGPWAVISVMLAPDDMNIVISNDPSSEYILRILLFGDQFWSHMEQHLNSCIGVIRGGVKSAFLGHQAAQISVVTLQINSPANGFKEFLEQWTGLIGFEDFNGLLLSIGNVDDANLVGFSFRHLVKDTELFIESPIGMQSQKVDLDTLPTESHSVHEVPK